MDSSPIRAVDTASSLAVSVIRGGRGMYASAVAPAAQPLELYEYEACPYCRKVREVLSELDLEYVSRASAKGSAKRADLEKAQFPYLVDPNTGTRLYESERIIDYLMQTYGSGRSDVSRWLSPLNTAGAAVASATRLRGRRVKRPRVVQPTKMLVLYNYEASPYCRKVREVLCELDLDAHIKNVARKSERRPELIEQGGKMQVPYLIDPNTGVAMYESAEIIEYLRSTYALTSSS